MLKKIFILFNLIVFQVRVFAGEEQQIQKTSSCVASPEGNLVKDISDGVTIAQAAVDVAVFMQKQLLPTETQDETQRINANLISVLKTENLFRRCLVEHAFKPRLSNRLPESCQVEADAFMATHDIYDLKAARDEFVAVTNELATYTKIPPPVSSATSSWSWPKTIAVYAFTIVSSALVLAPLLLPGGDLFVQGQKLISSTQNMAIKAQVLAVENSAELMAYAATHQLDVAAKSLQVAGVIREIVYQTPEEELKALLFAKQKQPSLLEQIKQAHQLQKIK